MKKSRKLSIALILGLALMIAPYATNAGSGAACGAKTSASSCTGKAICTSASADARMINSKASSMDKTACGADCVKPCCATTDGVKMTNAMGTPQSCFATATFSVKGMTCAGCENSVSSKLTKTDGVNEVMVVSHKSEKAVLTYDPKKVSTEDLAKAIKKLGFEAKYVEDTKKVSSEKM